MLTVPPLRLDGVAVKVTDVPWHTAPKGEAPMLTVGVTLEFTNIEIVFDVAVFVVRQVPPATVIVQVTASPLANVVLVKVFELLLCALLPFTLKS